jgi:hypothetical protein
MAIPLAAILQILLDRLLFNTGSSAEAAPTVTDTQEIGRSQIDVWRLEAQHLAQAARDPFASEANAAVDLETEQATDDIEAIAAELNLLLVHLEGA